MAVLKQGKSCPVCWPVVSLINKNLAQHSDHVLLYHVVDYVCVLHVARQIKNDSNHQIPKSGKVDFVCTISYRISSVQRKFRVGYNRAARLIESMEAAGVVSSMNSNGSREVLAAAPPRN